jgi:hypothetical protein
MNTNFYLLLSVTVLLGLIVVVMFLFNLVLRQRLRRADSTQSVNTPEERVGGGAGSAERVDDGLESSDSDASGSESIISRPEALDSPEDDIVTELNQRNNAIIALFMSEGWQRAEAPAEAALADCLERLDGAHWMTGRLLSTLGFLKMHRGDTHHALRHLESALAIVSEWPGICDPDEIVIKSNLAFCRDQRGF